jgi:hypothetical protein
MNSASLIDALKQLVLQMVVAFEEQVDLLRPVISVVDGAGEI